LFGAEHRRARVIEQLVDGGADVLRLNAGEARQSGKIK
jgi:pyruvate kinase